jgi:dienelactone hydrolase
MNNMKPLVITLCGSSKFKDQFEIASKKLTLEGWLVFTLGLYGHLEDNFDMSGSTKEMLDRNHLHKIDLSDAIYVINVGGYIGESTRNEINYALSTNKEIYFLERT